MNKLKILPGLVVGLLLFFVMLLCTQAALGENATSYNGLSRPVTSPTGEPQVGTLLYSDDFSSSKSGWPTYSKGSLLAAYKMGKYHVTAVPENYWDGVSAPRLNASDFIVEVEATKESGPDDNVYGIWMRNQEAGSFYTFMVSSDGYYDFAKKENGSWMTQSNWTKSGAIKTGNATNLIKVVAKGDRFSFYANGEKLRDYTDSSFAYGGMGLWVGSQLEGNVTIGFDNFKVWTLKD